MLAPVLIMLIIGIIEFGLIFFTYATSENVSTFVARQLALNKMVPSGAQAAAQSQMPRWVASATSVTVSQTTPGTPSTNQITVDLYFPAAAGTPTKVLSWAYGNLTLHSKVTMQQEATL